MVYTPATRSLPLYQCNPRSHSRTTDDMRNLHWMQTPQFLLYDPGMTQFFVPAAAAGASGQQASHWHGHDATGTTGVANNATGIFTQTRLSWSCPDTTYVDKDYNRNTASSTPGTSPTEIWWKFSPPDLPPLTGMTLLNQTLFPTSLQHG